MSIIRETAEMSDTERMAARNSNSEYLNEETNKREPLSNKVNSFSEDITEDDAKAQYPSVECLKNIVHIVESGTSGIWSYRKWSDGTAECWGEYIADISTELSDNGYYARGETDYISFPSELFALGSKPLVTCNNYGTGYLRTSIATVERNAVKFYLVTEWAENRNMTFWIKAIGRWK